MKLNSRFRIIAVIAILLITPIYQSCKISMTFTGASIPEKAKTFSVNFFPNQAELVNPNLSNKFTEALKDYVMRNSRLELVERNGDMHFEGEITGYRVTPQAIQGDATAAETRLSVEVNTRFVNKFEEDKSYESRFSAFADYSNSQSLSDVEDQLNDDIILQLVDDIFNKAFSNW